jgi:hypothetical protein
VITTVTHMVVTANKPASELPPLHTKEIVFVYCQKCGTALDENDRCPKCAK